MSLGPGSTGTFEHGSIGTFEPRCIGTFEPGSIGRFQLGGIGSFERGCIGTQKNAHAQMGLKGEILTPVHTSLRGKMQGITRGNIISTHCICSGNYLL